jgi:acetyl-CoA carboxylase carboxyl transferase subunit alpha
VISPEGCASILWKSADKAADAAEAMAITSDRLKALGLTDAVLDEPLGGAHRDPDAIAATVKRYLLEQLNALEESSMDEMLAARDKRIMSYGQFKE